MRTKDQKRGEVSAERSENPFTMDFGREPNEFIPRLKAMDELVGAFISELSPQHIAMITGVRGSGKTVFMTNACKRISELGNWTTVELSPEQDLLESLVKKLANERTLSKIFQHTQINLSFFGVGLKVEGAPPVSDPEVALERMLDSMNKHHRRVLIAIDEVVNNHSMRVFSSIFQILLRKDLPVFLLMTGLFENIRALQDQKTLTFLYRAPRIALMPLNIGIMADRYQAIFQLERNQALQMAKETRGYSFAFQLLGFYTWQYPSDPKRVRSLYKQHLVEYVYEKIWTEMSEGDRKVAKAMAEVPDGNTKAIRALLNMETNQFNPYRIRLIRKGIADGDTYGVLKFALPMFEEFVQENTF